MKYARILAEVASTPWALQPHKLSMFLAVLRREAFAGRVGAGQIELRLSAMDQQDEQAAKIHPNTDRAIAGKQGSVALLPLRGLISARAPLVQDQSMPEGASCERFMATLRALQANEQIKAIVIDADTPGGSVMAVSEAHAEIMSMRGNKPMIFQVNNLAASAGYWLASGFDEIVVTPSSQSANIGVYTVHEDISEWLKAEGVTESLIYAGKYKVEGNPYEPLGAEARAAIQAEVDDYYGLFVDDVARGRGVKASAVISGMGQGRCLRGPAAVEAGVADRLGTLEETLARLGVKTGAKSKSGASAAMARRRLDLEELE